jgi:hypothetical protein
MGIGPSPPPLIGGPRRYRSRHQELPGVLVHRASRSTASPRSVRWAGVRDVRTPAPRGWRASTVVGADRAPVRLPPQTAVRGCSSRPAPSGQVDTARSDIAWNCSIMSRNSVQEITRWPPRVYAGALTGPVPHHPGGRRWQDTARPSPFHQGLLRVTLPDGREHAASPVWSTSPVPGDEGRCGVQSDRAARDGSRAVARPPMTTT